MKGKEMEREENAPAAVTALLLSFRRRSLVAAAMKLALYAALLNEAARWALVGARIWLSPRVPVVDLGLFFFVALLLPLRRRWAPAAAATRLDERLDLKDRYTSLVDFAARPDVSPAIRRAQADETARAVEGVSAASASPFPYPMLAGPLLLVFSLIYPHFLLEPSMRPYPGPGAPPQVANLGPSERPSGGGEEGERREPPPPRERTESEKPKPPDPPAAGEKAAEEAGKGHDEEHAQEKRDFAGAPQSRGPAGDRPPIPGPLDLLDRAASETVGRKLSRVLDQSPPGKGEEQGGKDIKGRMTYRIVPSSPLTGEGASPAAAEGAPVALVVDFDSIAEKYRPLVKRYFTLLAAGTSTGKETP